MWKKCCPCIRRTYEPPDIQELDYRHGSLCEVPAEIFTYERTLEKLDLGSNQISDLPPNLFHCHELRELDLCDNDLKEIPAAIETLTRLAKLDVSRNALSEVPESIKNCKNLTYLDLSLNQLTKLPEAICQLVHLEELFLNETALEFLPANFGRLTKLKILELRENLLQTLPKSMSRLHQLQRLDIGSNDIEELPEVIGTMTSLTELWADNNCIRDIPKFIGNLTKLSCLDLSKNDVREISSDIGKCTNLVDITLTHNTVSVLPETFTKLENVTTIRIDSNCITRLPDDIGKLKNLQELSAVGNALKSLPPSVGLLRKLHTLYLDENRLTELPIEIGSCTSLTVLSVAKNSLNEIPSEVGHLAKLRMLKLTNNLIQNLPVSILGLTNLSALWLTDAQNKPLVALNREIDSSTGQHVVTCCLLPQLPSPDVMVQQRESEEEAPRRSERKIRFQNEIEPPTPEKPAANGGLLRAPTPYPKELRALAKHASHIRQAKSQNGEVINISDEPMYEGDEDEHVTRETYEMKTIIEKREILRVMPSEDIKTDKTIPDRSEPIKYINTVEKHDDEKPTSWPPPEINGSMNTIGLPEVPYNPTPYVEDIPPPLPPFSIGRTPPPYHIAAKRAAFFRSSGGAGSGRINFSSDVQPTNSDVINQNVPIPSVSAGQYSVSEDAGHWNQGGFGVMQEPNNISPLGQYPESTPSPVDNIAFNETSTVQYNDMEVSNHTMDYDYGGILSDKNANITSKPQYSMDVGDNANVHLPQDRYHDDQIMAMQHLEISREIPVQNINLMVEPIEQRVANVAESRIPMLSQKTNNIVSPVESKVSRIPSMQGPNKRQISMEAPQSPTIPSENAPPSNFMYKDRDVGKPTKTGIPMHFETRMTPPSKPISSTSKIPNKFGGDDKSPVDNFKRAPPHTPTNLKFSSGIPKQSHPQPQPSNNANSDTNQAQDKRKSNSRIPKFDAPKASPEEVSLPSSPTDDGKRSGIPSYTPVHNDKAVNIGVSPQPVRSGIPKPPTGRTPSPTGSKIPRKPWIFGSHKNARVVFVEHRKASQYLGFTIDDFAGQLPEGKGIYVTGTDSEDLLIKIGDKILQIDGIDVGNMGVEIVKKILGNCQETIHLLVSRQQ